MDSGITENKLISESYLMNIDNLRVLMDIYKFGDINSKIFEFLNKNGKNLTESQINTIIQASLIDYSPIMRIFLDMEMDIGANKELTSFKVEWYNNYVEMLYQNLISNSENLNTEIAVWLSNNKLM